MNSESNPAETFDYVRAWFLFHAGYSLERLRQSEGNWDWIWVRDIANFSGRPHTRFRLAKK